MRLLVIEDDEALRESLCKQLVEAGFGVEQAGDGREGLYYALEYPVDLAIVDLGLPEMSGIDVIREARDKGKTYPILILTARDRWQDKVDGLDAGADDYVVKPFHFEEVSARVNALLRRSGGWASSVLSAGPITLDTSRQELKVDDSEIELDERLFTLQEAYDADEAFITGASMYVCPVVRIDDRQLGDGAPGPVTRRLQEVYLTFARSQAI